MADKGTSRTAVAERPATDGAPGPSRVSRDELVDLLNDDLAREYQAIIAYIVYSQMLKGAEYMSIAEELEVESFVRENGPTIIDDHLPFIQAGLKAIDLIDFDYQYWHTLEDTPDKCSGESLDDVGRVLLEYIWRQK